MASIRKPTSQTCRQSSSTTGPTTGLTNSSPGQATITARVLKKRFQAVQDRTAVADKFRCFPLPAGRHELLGSRPINTYYDFLLVKNRLSLNTLVMRTYFRKTR